MKSPFGENMRIARTTWGYTQERAAELIGISRASVAAYELSNAQPSFEILEKIIEVYRIVDLSDFIFDPHYFSSPR
ncbi:helix-turn-helix transcriptional regulator [Flavihumibacter petaseus]|uniref:Putative Xre family transcriptional regulator n=1 Tax=Flavihumibacter petaseus NBRC 106054 TaxID=1220578 RepID=A0A0E9N1X4_9BACT|nr:helix-turn-helix transcriptional regulator [Flavihumibacter petaseus]GAO43778.1 putative Xre family transcriptional regulator [Flavihumibacter petaseus NBRC 106054]